MKRSKIQPLGPIMCDLNSIELDDDEIELLLHPLIGGVILFSRNYESPEQLLELTLKIHQLRQPRLLIAVDHEGGRVQRFQSGFSLLPACALIGECEPLARAMRLANHAGWLMATELLSIEVDLSFAPVLDVGGTISDVIGDRAFHTEPDKISKLANAFMVGMKEAGMSAVGKHFPGHGSIKEDSHISIPIDNRQLHDINSHDIVPFKALIDAGISGLMPAHIIYSAIDDKPAGFSSTWLDEILRKQLKFKGTIFSDDLSMRGAETIGDYTERTVVALEAGCDMTLICNNREGVVSVLDNMSKINSNKQKPDLENMHGNFNLTYRELKNEKMWLNRSKEISSFLEKTK